MTGAKPLKLDIDKKSHSITLIGNLEDKRCHILTGSYGEITSVELNRTELKRVIGFLNKFMVIIK